MTSSEGLARARAVVEVVHHAAAAGDVDAAAAVLYNHAYGGPTARLTRVLGAYELALDALTDLYPFRDRSLDPRLDDPAARRWVLHETALCLHVLGQLPEAAALSARSAAAALAMADQHSATLTYQNLAETHLAAGALGSCRAVAIETLRMSRETDEREDELVACTILGTLDDLTGRHEEAAARFDRALHIAEVDTATPFLYSLSGLRYADHLVLVGRLPESREVTGANLEFCREQGWQSETALTLAQQGRQAGTGQEAVARLTEAVRLARGSGDPLALATTLVARGNVFAEAHLREGRGDLAEALDIAQSFGFRLLEVDARVGMAAVRRAASDVDGALAEVELAERLADQLQYVLGAERARQTRLALP